MPLAVCKEAACKEAAYSAEPLHDLHSSSALCHLHLSAWLPLTAGAHIVGLTEVCLRHDRQNQQQHVTVRLAVLTPVLRLFKNEC